MTLEGILFFAIAVALMMNWPVAGLLVWQAWKRPRIMALTVMAVSSVLIAGGLTAYVFAVINAAAAYPVPRELAQIWLRAILLGLALFPFWFLWLFLTGRFRDRSGDA